MTSREALAGFGRLQAHFKPGKSYKVKDLNPVWPELLPCSAAAFERAIGIIIKNSRFLPDPGYVLEQTKYWEDRMRKSVFVPADGDVVDLGHEVILLFHKKLSGEILSQEYISRLYWLSEKTGNAEFAEAARDAERLQGARHGS